MISSSDFVLSYYTSKHQRVNPKRLLGIRTMVTLDLHKKCRWPNAYNDTHTATYVPFFCYLYQCFITICFLVDCMFEFDKRNLSIIKLLLLYIHIKIVLIINCTTVDLARNQIKSGEYITQILTPSNEPMKKYL